MFDIIEEMNTKQLYKEIYNRFGFIKRARFCFLYTKKGIRLTDMFLEDGRAILGWQSDSIFTQFKNTLNRSLVGGFITEDHSKVEKAVSEVLHSKRKVLYFTNKADAMKAALSFSVNNTSVYTPWNQSGINWNDVDSAVIKPPLPWTDNIYLVAVKEELYTENDSLNDTKFPYAVEVGIARALYNLIEALQTREEKDWFIYDTVLTKYWERKGPYLYTKVPSEKYDDFVKHCLDCGIVINPGYNSPSIVPFGADKGVFTKLKNNPFEF